MNDGDLIDDSLATGTSIGLTEQSKSFLNESAKWGRFLAIVGFIMMGLTVLGMFYIIAKASELGTRSEDLMMIVIPMILTLIIMFVPTLYLFKFATKTLEGFQTSSANSLQEGLKNHKSLFKFMGIYMIVVLSIYALALLVVVIAGF